MILSQRQAFSFFGETADDGKALEIGDTFSVAVGEGGESLFVDLLDFLKICGDVDLSRLLPLYDEVPCLFDVFLA